MAITKPVKLYIDPDMIQGGKNTSGVLGEKCNKCGGFGYTIALKGGKLDCIECEMTGVKLPTRRELQNQISELKLDLHNLRKAVLSNLGIKPSGKESLYV